MNKKHAPNRLLTDAFREIKHTKSRFLSLFLLSALAVAFLSGLRTTAPDMEHTADSYYDRTHLMDLRILSTLGLTDEDIQVLSGHPGVAAAEGAWYADAVLHAAQNDYIIRFHSLSQAGINQPDLLEGRLPQAPNECVVEPGLLSLLGLSIGDTISPDMAGTSFDGSLREGSYTVVGTVNSSLYLSKDRGSSTIGTGRLTAVAFLPREAFQLDYYTEAYLLMEGGAELLSYGEPYQEKVDALVDTLEPLGDQRAAHRYDEVIQEANDALRDAQQEYDQADADAKRQLAQGETELAEARRQLDAGWAEYYSGRITLSQRTADALRQIEEAEGQLAQALPTLEQGEEEHKSGMAQYQQGLQTLEEHQRQYDQSHQELTASEEEYNTLRQQLQQAQDAFDQAQSPEEVTPSPAPSTEPAQPTESPAPQPSQIPQTVPTMTAEELEERWKELELMRQQLDAAWAELETAKAELDTARQQLQQSEAQLTAARQELEAGWAEYHTGQDRLIQAKQSLTAETAAAQRELGQAYQELTDGETEYNTGLREYESGKAEAEKELSSARRQLNDARRDVAEIENCKWYILDRNTNAGYVSYQQDAQRMGNLGSVFPIIFFLVAALVCLTTMTRMVEEQRVQIGGLKALGYSRSAIAFKYVGYGLLASLGGGLVGLVVGSTLIPTIIFNAWKVLYTVGDLEITFFPGISLLSVGAAVLCVTGTALATAFATLAAVPASLMRPRAPQAGKRVLLERFRFLWKRLTFAQKVAVRNLFRYKRRFWMTVIGIGGCTALLITGLGLRDSIRDIFDRQFQEITTYHAQVALADNITGDDLTEITLELEDNPLVDNWGFSSSSMVSAESEHRTVDSFVSLVTVADSGEFGSFVRLQDRRTGEAIPLSDSGVVITEKLSELLNVQTGDSITIINADNDRVSVPVAGISENYVMHYIYLTQDLYRSLYGEEPPTNSIFLQFTENTVETSDAVASQLISLAGVSSISRTEEVKSTVAQGLDGVDYAVVVVVVAAAALAFVVLYNLTNINITERLRELATLKVLGFYDRELSAYVYRENVCLTFFGVLLGLVMGKFLHQWLVHTVEIDMAMFGRSAAPMSYVLSVALTVLFSLLVNLAARRRLKKIDMVESLKTVE